MREEASLAQVLLAELEPTGVVTGAPLDVLEALLESLVARGRAAWPGIDLAPRRFVTSVGARLAGQPPALEQTLASLHGEDLWLVCAALERHPVAVRALVDLLGTVVREVLATMSAAGDLRAEVLQETSARLWMGGTSSSPALATYSGRGSLRAWLSMIVLREGLRRRRPGPVALSLEEEVLARLGRDSRGPEDVFARDNYRGHLRQAVRTALAELGPQERNLLRYQVIDGLTSQEIARICGVNRATVWRWMTRLEARLGERVRGVVGVALGTSDAREIDSVIRSAQSQMSISLSDLLRPDDLPPSRNDPAA